MGYLKNITRLSASDNLGGIVELRVARKAVIDTIPEPVNGIVYGDITLKAGGSFFTWKATQESASLRSNSRQSKEGVSRQNQIPFRIPKDREDIYFMLEQAEEDEFVVLVKYPNAKWKIFGLLDSPVQFEFDHDSGSAFADGNFYSCRFYYEGPGNLFFYNGSTPSAPAGTAPAIVRFNGAAIASLAPGETLNITSDFGFTNFYVSS
jgi:hypothetical protein